MELVCEECQEVLRVEIDSPNDGTVSLEHTVVGGVGLHVFKWTESPINEPNRRNDAKSWTEG